jgi:hypothetical protein
MRRNYIASFLDNRPTIEKIIAGSGLYSLIASGTSLSAYYVEQDPTNDNEYNEWLSRAEKVQELLGERSNGRIDKKIQRLWVYGRGTRAIPYSEVTGQFRPSEEVEARKTYYVAELKRSIDDANAAAEVLELPFRFRSA